MSELKKLAGEMLDHLQRYHQAGVRLTANVPRSTPRKPVSSARPSTPAKVTTRERPVVVIPKSSLFAEPTAAHEEMKTIRTHLGECQRCKLAPTRTNIVFGTGDPHAELMFVGEAPGEEDGEDRDTEQEPETPGERPADAHPGSRRATSRYPVCGIVSMHHGSAGSSSSFRRRFAT